MGAHVEGIEPSPTLGLGLADPGLAVDFFPSGHARCVMVVPFFFSLSVPAVEMVGALALLLRSAHDGAAVVSLFFNFSTATVRWLPRQLRCGSPSMYYPSSSFVLSVICGGRSMPSTICDGLACDVLG
uniref:Uncharacterized protein n=1 Tax=Arundo donax TaxID=35708 RepID=A0A0A9HZ06_ARUDO